jgi:two-component system, chemotaxis family, chemotaxis protein CheY
VKVLIVDDSYVVAQVIAMALRGAGINLTEVVHAVNCEEGLAKLRQTSERGTPVGLIVSGLHMPGMDGLGFMAEMKREGLATGVPLLMVTGDGGISQAIAAGAQGYISKPFTSGQMRTQVAPLLSQAGLG